MATVALPKAAFNPFIVSTDVQKTDDKTRKLIRSHVMLGKNRGKKRIPKESTVKEAKTSSTKAPSSNLSSDNEFRASIPPKVGCETSLIKLAADVEPLLVQNVLRFTTHSKAQLFPLEPCIHFSGHQSKWVEPLSNDDLYCHAILFAAQAAFGMGSSKDTNGSAASHHFGKAVRLLRLRLAQGDRAVTTRDTTLMVITVLATAAMLTGQDEVARHHLQGVKRIMELRGGFAGFADSVKLLVEMLRIDIGLTLMTGQPPLFFHQPFAGPQLAHPQPSGSRFAPSRAASFESLLPTLNGNLAYIWRSLRDFCKTVNTASRTQRRLPEQMLLDSMASAVYPLLNMRFECGSMSETCRLGLLAFCSNAFLQWQGMNVGYKSLPSLYRQTLLRLGQSKESVPPQAMLWLLMMGGIALFTGEEDRTWLLPWLEDVIGECTVVGWENVQDILKSFLWVNFIHDRLGERLYSAAIGHNRI